MKTAGEYARAAEEAIAASEMDKALVYATLAQAAATAQANQQRPAQ